MRRSKLLSPASTCPTGIPSLTEAKAVAKTPFVSPSMRTSTSFVLFSSFSMLARVLAVCVPCERDLT